MNTKLAESTQIPQSMILHVFIETLLSPGMIIGFCRNFLNLFDQAFLNDFNLGFLKDLDPITII